MGEENPVTIKPDLARRVQEEIGENVFLCYQCVKCTSGCPFGDFFDWQPHQIMRAVQLGQEDVALNSKAIWICAACQTCTTRCPQGIDIAGVMEFLTQEARRRGIEPKVPEVAIFNKAFLREVDIWGRAYELGLIAEMNIRTGKPFEGVDLGIRMIQKGKIKFVPTFVRPPRKVKPIEGAESAVAYYPGCSLESTATEFDISARATAEVLGLKLIEPDGWLCCGSTPAHRSDPHAALMLPMRNMALFEQSGFKEVTMPCAACFNQHKKALYRFRHRDVDRQTANRELGYEYRDNVRVSTLIEVFIRHVGIEKIRAAVKKPLTGLRVATYYGCLLTRPPKVTGAGHPENPTDMDEIIRALGAEVIEWQDKTTCCGATHSLTKTEIVLEKSGGIIRNAQKLDADVIALACPLCHTNLDGRQFQMGLDEPMPILYFTQLMALAFGLGRKEMALHKNMVDPRPVLREKGLLD